MAALKTMTPESRQAPARNRRPSARAASAEKARVENEIENSVPLMSREELQDWFDKNRPYLNLVQETRIRRMLNPGDRRRRGRRE